MTHLSNPELVHAIATLQRIRERYEATPTDYDKKLIPLWEARVRKLREEVMAAKHKTT